MTFVDQVLHITLSTNVPREEMVAVKFTGDYNELSGELRGNMFHNIAHQPCETTLSG
jgi:hypothetical protein